RPETRPANPLQGREYRAILCRWRESHTGRNGGGRVRKRFAVLGVVGLVVAAATVVGFTGSARSAAKVSALPSSSCGPIVYKGQGSPDFIVPTDLPLQGAIRKLTVEVGRAALWALQEAGWKAGQYKIAYQSCDDSTAQTGGWDTAKCATNAHLF